MSRIGDLDAGNYDVDTMVPLSRMEAILLDIRNNGTGGEDTLKRIVVDELPTTGIDENAIYLVPGANPEADNNYDEYTYVNGHWEMISTADNGEISKETIDDLWTDSDVGHQEDSFED